MGSENIEIGQRVKSERELLGWSQPRLANESGLTQPMISRIESGSRKMYVKTAVKLSDALGVTIDWLIKGE